MESRKARIVMLCGPGQSSRIMYHGLAPHADIAGVVIEKKPAGGAIIRRRIRKLGFPKTAGQLLFILLNRAAARASRERIARLLAEYRLDDGAIPEAIVSRVGSVNDEETVRRLRELRPDAVVVNGTRIISKKVLEAVGAHFINTHMGITPRYRGVHGGYWALAMGDREHCGVTVHLVDAGIDTGGVLYQDVIHPDERDNFNTYPIHQIARAIPLMRAALSDVVAGKIRVRPGVPPSRLWHHPTAFEYLGYRLRRGVK